MQFQSHTQAFSGTQAWFLVNVFDIDSVGSIAIQSQFINIDMVASSMNDLQHVCKIKHK